MAIDLTLVRALIGDADIATEMLGDDQIKALAGDLTDMRMVAAECADALAAKFGRLVTQSIDGASFQYGDRAKFYQDLALRLRGRATSSNSLGTMFVGGTSQEEMRGVESDPDRTPSEFGIGMHDNPGTDTVR